MKSLSKLLVSIAFLCFVGGAHASMSDAELARAMREDIKKYFVTLKSPKVIFHWVDASDINPPGQYNNKFPSTSPHFATYVDLRGRAIYQKLRMAKDMAGPGVYFASDATMSRAYGGKKTFGLIVGVLRQGAKIIQDARGMLIDPQIQSEHKLRGCDRRITYAQILGDTDPICTKIKQLLVGTDISFADGQIYQWFPSTVVGCSSLNPSRDLKMVGKPSEFNNMNTFVAYSSRLFSHIYGYTHKSALSGDPFGDQMLSYLKGLSLQNKIEHLSVEQMRDPSIKPMSVSDISTFNKKFILGCK